MGQYNPNEPCTMGLEWFPERRGITFLDSNPKAVGMKLTAGTSDNIRQLVTFLRRSFGGYSVLSLEVFDITGGLPALDPTEEFDYLPTSTRFAAPDPWYPGSFVAPSTFGGPLWQSLNSTSLTPSTWPNSSEAVANSEFVFNLFGLGFSFSVGFGGVSGTQAGRWITRIRSYANCAQYLAEGATGSFQIQPYIRYGSDIRPARAQAVDVAQGVVPIFHDWHFNPITGACWTATDVNKFDSGYGGPDPLSLGWAVAPTGSSNNMATILNAKMVIESAPTDQRKCIGSTILAPKEVTPNGTIGWQAITLRDPGDWATEKNLTLVPGRDYLFVLRRGGELDSLAPSYLSGVDGEFMIAEPKWSSYQPTIDAATLRPTKLNDESPRVYASILMKPDDTASLDSQVYMTASPVTGIDEFPALNSYYDNVYVNEDRSLNQEFTATFTDGYGWVSLLVSQVSTEADAPLVIGIYDNTTDALVGAAPVEIATGDLQNPENDWQRVGVRISDVPLVSGTQYYFGISSAATPSKGWLVQVVNTGRTQPPAGPPHWSTTTALAYFGEDVDFLRLGTPVTVLNPINRQHGVSACVTLSRQPSPIVGLTATATAEVCCISHVDLTWSTTIDLVCGDFGYYEIERRDIPTGRWYPIARVTDPLVGTLQDYESRRNMPANYRIRLVRDDRVPSDWSAIVTATATMACVGLIFTANATPEASVFYVDLADGQTRAYSFPRNFTMFQPQGSDGQVAYFEIADRLETFARKLRIRAGTIPCMEACDDPGGYSTDVFRPMINLSRAGLPYVCVHEESGKRWFAFVNTPAGQWTQHGGPEREGGWAVYTLDVQIIEETNVPNTVDSVVAAGS